MRKARRDFVEMAAQGLRVPEIYVLMREVLQELPAIYDAALSSGTGAKSEAVEALDTKQDTLLALLTILEERGVLAQIEEHLVDLYGRAL